MCIARVLTLVLLLAACAPDLAQPTATTVAPAIPPSATAVAPTAPASAAGATPAMPAGLPRGAVVHVVDGDTLDVDLGGQTERVRLIGVDTPETVRPNTPVECFGKEASAFAKQLLDGQAVYLEDDPSQDSRDKYGRLLRYVWLADGRLANLELVAGGYAYEYTYDQPYTYQQTFKQAQRDAQTARRGLWSPTTCNGAREAAATTASAPTAGQGAPAPPAGCSARPDPARAPNAPVAIVAVDKRAEVVTLKNVGDTPVDLGGWTLCSLRGAQTHPIGGVLAPGETKAFPGAPGAAIWSNGDRDDGALYDAQGRLISYWRDG